MNIQEPMNSDEPTEDSRTSDDPTDHYFSVRPQSKSRPLTYSLRTVKGRLTVTTDSGTFSHGHLDKGTKVLLEQLLTATPPLPEGPLLDIGCGAGPIAMTLAARFPDRLVYAVDVNERARDLCRSNATENGLDNIVVAHPDDTPSDIAFAGIWSNPPIRGGKELLHSILQMWLTRLAPGGYGRLVIHKNLGSDSLQKWLMSIGYACERVSSRSGFRILHVTSPAGMDIHQNPNS
jgi:16S rRNA G1207 methylase RsmC